MVITVVKASRRRDGERQSVPGHALQTSKERHLISTRHRFPSRQRLGPQLDRNAARSPHHRIDIDIGPRICPLLVPAASGSRRSLPGNCSEGRWAGPPWSCSMGTLRGGYLALRIASFFYSSSRGGSGVQYFFFLARLSLREFSV